jgi:hypothetical protein
VEALIALIRPTLRAMGNNVQGTGQVKLNESVRQKNHSSVRRDLRAIDHRLRNRQIETHQDTGGVDGEISSRIRCEPPTNLIRRITKTNLWR